MCDESSNQLSEQFKVLMDTVDINSEVVTTLGLDKIAESITVSQSISTDELDDIHREINYQERIMREAIKEHTHERIYEYMDFLYNVMNSNENELLDALSKNPDMQNFVDIFVSKETLDMAKILRKI